MSFNIRVYGILIRNNNEVLVTDEVIKKMSFTKFPGGGLKFGEGLKDCLKREFLEELQLPITVNDLFYLTEQFQVSAFDDDDQVISIYYNISATAEDLQLLQNRKVVSPSNEIPRWVQLDNLDERDFMFPIDKKVVKKLKS